MITSLGGLAGAGFLSVFYLLGLGTFAGLAGFGVSDGSYASDSVTYFTVAGAVGFFSAGFASDFESFALSMA